jgi:sporulation protein YqfC
MVKKRRLSTLRSDMIDFFELPKDILLDLPRLTLMGNIRLVIENHRGIIQYSSQLLRICLEQGELALSGTNLNITSISAEEIIVEGVLTKVEFLQ